VEEEGKRRKQVMKKQSLTTSHRQTDAQPVPEQKTANLPKPCAALFY